MQSCGCQAKHGPEEANDNQLCIIVELRAVKKVINIFFRNRDGNL